jgi:lipid-A-disaccharide synthase
LESSKKIFFVAGEKSGDLHGSNLIDALIKKNPSLQLVGWGGNDMQAKGMTLLKHYQEIAIMGFWEVIKNICKIKQFLETCKRDILAQQPNAVVLIDFGGFNMKIAKFCKEQGIEVHYYIAPKVWAWNTKRAYKIKAYVDYLYCILPFEVPFFANYAIKSTYVGNPVVDAIARFRAEERGQVPQLEAIKKPIIALLPGSRRQEVFYMLEVMLKMVDRFPNYQFVMAAVDHLDAQLYKEAREKGVLLLYNQTYHLLEYAKAALVASGTATLETGLFHVPQVVGYSANKVTYVIAKMVIKVKFISLINLIAEREVVKELIQADFCTQVVAKELDRILHHQETRNGILSAYQEIEEKLGKTKSSDLLSDKLLTVLFKENS